jgi:hypothetical protein
MAALANQYSLYLFPGFVLHRCLPPSQLRVLCPCPLSINILSQQMLEGHMSIINHHIVPLEQTTSQLPIGVLEV